jgi:hypothetical protein
MPDMLDIIKEWHSDAVKSNPEEADFIKKIIDEISSLRYQTQNPGLNITVGDWAKVDKIVSYATHKKSCAHSYGRCTCGFTDCAKEYDMVRNPKNYPASE